MGGGHSLFPFSHWRADACNFRFSIFMVLYSQLWVLGMTPERKKRGSPLLLEIAYHPCWPGQPPALRVHLRHDPDYTTPQQSTDQTRTVRADRTSTLLRPSQPAASNPPPPTPSLIIKAGRGESPSLFSSWLSVMDVRIHHPGHPSPWPPTSADRRLGCR